MDNRYLKGSKHCFYIHSDIGDDSLVASLLTEHRSQAKLNSASESCVGRSIRCPEKVAFYTKWIDAAQLEKLAEPMRKHSYGKYFLRALKEVNFS